MSYHNSIIILPLRMAISKHITYKEATQSNTAIRKGIDNTPDEEQLLNMIEIADNVFEPLREGLGNKPIRINSFFRSPKLNVAIGGSKNSQHCKGEAMDIKATVQSYHSNKQIAKYIIDNLTWDQLIAEYPDEKGEPAWVHVSYKRKGNNRKEVLMAFKDNDKTQYLKLDELAIDKLLG
jgi:hypothetical protein